MNRFVCKNCGMITDKPTIVPHLDKIGYYQELREELDKHKPVGAYSRILYDYKEIEYSQKYNHSITCPACLGETRFWREEPFPTDKTPEMKQERCDDEHCFLPKGHKGLHQAVAIITDKNDNIDPSSIPSRVI